MSETLRRIRASALAVLRPPAKTRLSDWIEKNVFLPHGVSALPGPVRLWPFQRDIADAIGDPAIGRVTLVKPVRVGLSTMITGALASYVVNDPAPILVLLPTEADCRDYAVSDIEPIFEASPLLAGSMSAEKDEAGRNTILSRRFPGGSLKIVPAKAPRNLRRHNVRILLIDEADGMEASAEGSPVLLAERRTLSFPDRKIVIGSTPVFEETSEVLRAYGRSDQRVFEVPCPECGSFTEILWEHIKWPDGPDSAAFQCPHCEALVDERHKPAMVTAGRWRAMAPEVRGHAGFRLNALVSLLANASWAHLAAEFVEVKSDPVRLQTFVNTILGQGWKTDGSEIDESEFADRAEPFGIDEMPEEVLAITGGIDVQRDRIEITLLGWSAEGTIFVLAHFVIWGSPEDNATWIEVDDVLKMRWRHPLGGMLGVEAAVVDSGDGMTMAQVYVITQGPFPGDFRL